MRAVGRERGTLQPRSPRAPCPFQSAATCNCPIKVFARMDSGFQNFPCRVLPIMLQDPPGCPPFLLWSLNSKPPWVTVSDFILTAPRIRVISVLALSISSHCRDPQSLPARYSIHQSFRSPLPDNTTEPEPAWDVTASHQLTGEAAIQQIRETGVGAVSRITKAGCLVWFYSAAVQRETSCQPLSLIAKKAFED